jgi:hypothetical protein
VAEPKTGTFHGAKYELTVRPDGKKQCIAVLPFPGAVDSRGVVVDRIPAYVLGKADLTDDEVIVITKHHVLYEAMQQSPPDDRAAWERRMQDARKGVRQGQILRPYKRGEMPKLDAVARLTDAGYTFAEVAELLHACGPVELKNQPAEQPAETEG